MRLQCQYWARDILKQVSCCNKKHHSRLCQFEVKLLAIPAAGCGGRGAGHTSASCIDTRGETPQGIFTCDTDKAPHSLRITRKNNVVTHKELRQISAQTFNY